MSFDRRKPLGARIGILPVGHKTYWAQFDGLLDELLAKADVLAKKVAAHGVTVQQYGMVDDATSAYAAVRELKAANLDLLMIDMVTYATSSTFGIIARELNIPIVLVALQPLAAMDYAHATTYMQLCNDDFCSVPEFLGVAIRLGRRPPEVILGKLHDDPLADAEIARWCRIACALADLKKARIGQMGHVLEAMLDMHADPTALTGAFGVHLVQCEPDEIVREYHAAGDAAVAAKREQILSFFSTPDPVSDPLTSRLTDADLETAAKVSVALDTFVEEKHLDGLAYYYEGQEGSDVRKVVTNLIVGNSLLCAAGFPMCGEFDVKTCIAMLILDRLGIGGSFAEFHPVDFQRDTVLVGHDGPHHIAIAEAKPVLRSLKKYHGKPGSGASVEFQIRRGPITMLSIGLTAAGKPKFVIAEGESIAGPIPPTGNTNTHGRFPPDVRTFLKRWVSEGPTHHFALGVGHEAESLRLLADALGIESVVVTGS